MRVRLPGKLFALALCIHAVTSPANSSEVSGIKGLVLVSPARPGPAKEGSEFANAAPLPNATFRVTRNGQRVTTFTTDAEGRFNVPLEPGQYVVLLAEHRFPKPCGPFEVSVEAGKMIDVQWRCDSGMR